MLVEPERTAYDLRFRVLRFPVRVHPFFWLGTALMGSRLLDIGPEFLLTWVAVVFVSILVHELGHAIAFRLFGTDAEIVLYAFGGLAIPWATVSGRWRRIIVSLAGPFAGFLLCGLVYGSNQAFEWAGPRSSLVVLYAYGSLIFVNLIWGFVNLLPVFPLDGGQVSRELCIKFWGRRGQRISLQISFGCALLLVAYSIFCVMDQRGAGAGFTDQLPSWVPTGTVYTAILFGVLAYQSYQLLQRIEWTDTHWDDRLPWER
ncbi:Peptidase family M50 [Gemmata sp. SH-PL17]|uniref:site-2 protease family protein n=1 Tax=Gemmata sp. SH-PL17 TaxID=1630693 RepID=UPI00078B7A92|nr:site-2 protease family protein [Gemmata sp. SH-PL17]AMV27937.1 Peptidase family M50 [Gemmata sp. SH-PL17]